MCDPEIWNWFVNFHAVFQYVSGGREGGRGSGMARGREREGEIEKIERAGRTDK